MKHALHAFVVMALVAARPAAAAPGVVFQTSVPPQAGEDVASDCTYELTLLDPSRTVRGVWVIFDRGRDMLRYYGDPDVEAFAQRHDFALLLAFHCRAKTSEDMDVDPSKGLGRALFSALGQFGERSHHPELASAKVVLLGFSGPGSLVARFPEFAPERVLATIPADAGQGDPLGLDTIHLSAKAARVPQLIVAGGSDAVSGTSRPYDYFRRHFDQGAPWTFIVQNKTPHCCIINAKALVLQWLDAVVRGPTRRTGWYGFIRTAPSDSEDCPNPRPALVPPSCHSTKDTWGGANWSVSGATVERRPNVPAGMMPAGWLPTRAFAQAWRSFVSQPEHPITSLP
jgi:hypothetical protein